MYLCLILEIKSLDGGVLVEETRHQHTIPALTKILLVHKHLVFTTQNLQWKSIMSLNTNLFLFRALSLFTGYEGGSLRSSQISVCSIISLLFCTLFSSSIVSLKRFYYFLLFYPGFVTFVVSFRFCYFGGFFLVCYFGCFILVLLLWLFHSGFVTLFHPGFVRFNSFFQDM